MLFIVLGFAFISRLYSIIQLQIVKAFSSDSLVLSLRTSSQYLFVVSPSVVRAIFLSSSDSLWQMRQSYANLVYPASTFLSA